MPVSRICVSGCNGKIVDVCCFTAFNELAEPSTCQKKSRQTVEAIHPHSWKFQMTKFKYQINPPAGGQSSKFKTRFVI